MAGAAILGVAAWSITEASRAADWSRRHVAALASGALLSRALLAFTYDPLIGEVPAGAKYAHNAVMLGLVAIVSLRAWRQPAITSASPDLHRHSLSGR